MDKKQTAKEFQDILSRVMNEDSTVEPSLFKNIYQVFLCGNLFTCPKPLGDIFKKSIVVCGTKDDLKNLKSSSGSAGSGDFSLRHSSKDSFECGLEDVGSPLECVFDSALLGHNSPKIFRDMLKSSSLCKTCVPVSVNTARYIFDLCNISKTNAINKLPLLVLCDSKDPQQTVLMGIFRKNKNSRIMVTSNGSYVKKEDMPKFQTIKKKHPKSFNSIFETSAFAHYDIFRDSTEDTRKNSVQPSKDCSLAVECTWNNVSAVLQMPAADAMCELIFQTIRGDEHTGAFARFKELRLVQALSNCLQSGKMIWPYNERDDQLFEKLSSFMDGLAETGIRQRVQHIEFCGSDADFDTNFKAAATGNRSDLDFTDELWLILKGCSSCQELTGALEFIFKELRNTSTPLFIYRKNTSTIGKLARNVNKQTLIFPSLESTMPMQLLLEIGVEKLQRDYIMLFAGLELSPYDNLIPYLQHDKLSVETVCCLEKLHSILEITVMCWNELQVSKLILNSIVRFTLKHYLTLPAVDPTNVLKFPISFLNVKSSLEKHEPTEWQASLLTKCNGYNKQTVLNLTNKPVFEYECSEKLSGSQQQFRKNLYYCTTCTLIEDDFMMMKKSSPEDQQKSIKK